MVPEASATYAGPTEKTYNQFSIDADHSNIVKFSDCANQDYLNIRQRILGFVEEAPGVIKKRLATSIQCKEPKSTAYVSTC